MPDRTLTLHNSNDLLRFNYLAGLNSLPPERSDAYVVRVWGFRPTDLLENSVEVVGQGFAEHLAREKPSGAPGIDIDVRYNTEHLPTWERPIVRSPVSGEVIFSGGQYGTVRIKDKNGYEHRILHMYLDSEGPIGGRVFPLGKYVKRGDPIGVIGDVHPLRKIRDHVHYSVIKPDGGFADPKKLYFGEDGAVERYKSFEDQLLDSLIQRRNELRQQDYDRIDAPDVSGLA
ncbi:TPA: M23 family metallopeptidase [Pseudomonas putida]|uniref:Peptidase M23B n=1 Tax=Pseudomonas putida (strain GB-1) TaxID=76869 RepID=B0KRA0_PSEPG|nr:MULTISPECIES: M23 family metallopeptidase [Pseudomonas]ABZ01305.1 peptidase M23B [Pseudomonas putida GB-1]MBP0710271.1 M23 family metallopeptidase [Pseudomonas sp. T34]MCK2189718.1 M23 family metallopeptidase [Pseudomonas sp. MB04B]MDD2084575.1 M23 family metallopeptidase [Pseudomonas putida]MDD2094548.1 M23 family metallopeptidase [Pseudomonas putida]